MANEEQVRKLQEGVEAWNQWREENPLLVPDLKKADLSNADLSNADLNSAFLIDANLGGTDLRSAVLSGADLNGAFLIGAALSGADLSDAFLTAANLGGTDLRDANLSGADLSGAFLSDADLSGANLSGADLISINLSGANLSDADLNGVNLHDANLSGADLNGADLGRAKLSGAKLSGADLSDVFFDARTTLKDAVFSDGVSKSASVSDVHWGGVNLAVVDWEPVKKLGDEYKARSFNYWYAYLNAARANRQLAVVLRDQGLNEQADHFAYRAQLLQRVVWRKRRRPLKYLFSLFLDLLAGYGYRPGRSVLAYLLVIVCFAFGYYQLTHVFHAQPYPLAWYEALVLSVSSFHGRGFFQPVQSLGDPVAIAASIEAVLGLLIEISFIATFTQRFFGR